MGQINPNIALGSVQAPVKLMMPVDTATQGLTLSDLISRNQISRGQAQLQQQALTDQKTLASLYAQHTNSDGTIDAPGIITGLGQAGSGHLIPAFMTQQQDLASKKAVMDKDTADAAGTNTDTLLKTLSASTAGVGSLLAKPDVSHDDVVHQLYTQIQQKYLTVPQAQATISDMPPSTGNPAQDSANLHNWLVQQNLKIADAKTRLEATTAKPTAMNNGKVTTLVDQNPITNPSIIGATMRMTTTPGEDLSSSTERRGQDLNFRTANNSVVETPGGYTVVNKQTGAATPVMNANGTQALPTTSPVFKNEQQLSQMQTVAQAATDLLNNNPTHSLMGVGIDKALGWAGQSLDGADKATQLEALGGWMTSNVPRMEGPQSDADRKSYESQAGNVGDATLPVSQRLAALQTVMTLQRKYAAINGGNGATPLGTQPVTVVKPAGVAGAPPVVPGGRPPLSAFQR